MKKIRGLIFDMDGTLLDTEKIYFQCWLQSAKELGFPMSEEAALHVRSCCAAHAEPYFRQLYGTDFDYYKVRDRRRELVSQYIAAHGVEQKPGIAALLEFCKLCGCNCNFAGTGKRAAGACRTGRDVPGHCRR